MKGRLRSIVAIAIAVASLAATHDLKAGLSAAGGKLRVQARRERPDVIVVLTDQQRADAFGAAGAADLHTPVMDRLARQGVLFTRAFAATPQCSPSRAALLTGPLSSPDRSHGQHRRRRRRWQRRWQPARGDVGGPRSLAADARADLRRRRIRDGLLRQMASRRHARRLRVRVARLEDSPTRRSPAASSSSCRSAPRTERAGRCC